MACIMRHQTANNDASRAWRRAFRGTPGDVDPKFGSLDVSSRYVDVFSRSLDPGFDDVEVQSGSLDLDFDALDVSFGTFDLS